MPEVDTAETLNKPANQSLKETEDQRARRKINEWIEYLTKNDNQDRNKDSAK